MRKPTYWNPPTREFPTLPQIPTRYPGGLYLDPYKPMMM